MKSESKMFNVMLPNSDFSSSYLDLFISVMLGCSISSLGHTHAFIATSGPIFGFGNFVGSSAKISSRPGNVIAGA